MADISMCKGTNCPKKDTCYRTQAPINPYRQSWFANVPVDAKGECQYYWPMESKSQLRRFDAQTRD